MPHLRRETSHMEPAELGRSTKGKRRETPPADQFRINRATPERDCCTRQRSKPHNQESAQQHAQSEGRTASSASTCGAQITRPLRRDLTRPPDYPTALQTCARLVPERLLLHATLTIRPASPPRVAIIVGVWLPHAALIPSIGIRPGPFAFPCPSSFVSSPRPIASVDSGKPTGVNTQSKTSP